MRKVFLDSLPIWKEGTYKNKIKWKESIGHMIKFRYDDIEGEIEIVDYIQDGQYLMIKYSDVEPYKMTVANFTKCNFQTFLGFKTSNFKIEIGKHFKDDKRDLIILNKKYIKDDKGRQRKFYNYKCNKCSYSKGWSEESQLLRGSGCACCCTYSQTSVLGINTIWDTDRWMCDLGVSEEDAKKYTRGSIETINVTCPYCNKIKKTTPNNICKNKSIACTCGDGIKYPEKFMMNLLSQLNIDFIYQYQPKWIDKKRYDFYIPSLNIIIETDGGWHKKDNNMSGFTAKESKQLDKYKEVMAFNNGISIIRIDCEESNMEYIKNNILFSKLNTLFDLSQIDWLKCEETALKNKIKDICEYKKNNPELTSTEIGDIFKLCRTTIVRYLKKGNKLGWVEYDSKKEHDRVISFKCKSYKQVEIFKNNISLGIFNGAREISRISEEKFGVKLNWKNISQVCNNEKKTHKGYTFKFV